MNVYGIQYHTVVESVSLNCSCFPCEVSGFDYASISNMVRHAAEQHSTSVFGWTSVSISAWAWNTVVFLLTKAFTVASHHENKWHMTCDMFAFYSLWQNKSKQQEVGSYTYIED